MVRNVAKCLGPIVGAHAIECYIWIDLTRSPSANDRALRTPAIAGPYKNLAARWRRGAAANPIYS
jgi:hypothetical protein